MSEKVSSFEISWIKAQTNVKSKSCFSTAKMESRGTLIGSNAAVNSVDFDSTGAMVLATSNDYASRVWTVADQRLRVSLGKQITLSSFSFYF